MLTEEILTEQHARAAGMAQESLFSKTQAAAKEKKGHFLLH